MARTELDSSTAIADLRRISDRLAALEDDDDAQADACDLNAIIELLESEGN